MKLKDRFAKLIDVKTIVTFALTATFVYLCLTDKIESQVFMPIYTTVLGFYFGSNVERHKGDNNVKEN